MKRYTIAIGDKTYNIGLQQEGENQYRVLAGGGNCSAPRARPPLRADSCDPGGAGSLSAGGCGPD